MNRVTIVFLLSLTMSACATTEPYGGAGIDYRLPRTDATVTAALTLRSCAEVKADAALAVVPEAGAQATVYRLSGEDLASASIKRDVSISVSEAGVIMGVNTTSQDKTPEIIGNVIKIAGTAATVGPGMPIGPGAGQASAAGLRCKQEVSDAVARTEWLRGEIRRLRAALVTADGASSAAFVKALNRAARELASLEDGILRIDTTGSMKLDRPASGDAIDNAHVEIDWEPFAKWFGEPPVANQNAHKAELVRNFGLKWSAKRLPAAPVTSQPVRPQPKSLRACRFAMAVPAVSNVAVHVQKAGSALPEVEVKKAFPAAQWSDPEKLCLDVGFGEGRSVALDFDRYGRTTEFAWSSEATAATVSAAIAGYATDAAGILATLEGPNDLAKMKAEIDEIETEQKLSELRRCKTIREAGGDCAAEE